MEEVVERATADSYTFADDCNMAKTGHTSLNRHLHIMGYVEDPNCECGEEPQTPIHILTRCTRLAGLRTAVLGRPEIRPENIKDYRPKKILKFAMQTGLWNFD